MTVLYRWKELTLEDYQFINVTAEDIRKSGQDPSPRVRWEEASDAYPAQVEFAHKIHCLNEIRKEVWGEHYFGLLSISAGDNDSSDSDDGQGYTPVTNKPTEFTLDDARGIHRQHTMHCIHMLLQDLMCNVDVGIITHNWMRSGRDPEAPAYPMADFSTQQKCRNFDAAAEWVRKHAVSEGNIKFGDLEGSARTDSLWDNDTRWQK